MKKFLLFATAFAFVSGAWAQDEIQLESFPGAEGYGRYTTGGRGGDIYHVTSLEDDGSEGTFRWACSKSGARTIVFDVSGVIYLKSQLKLNQGNVTIAGQTSPGGICIADYPFQISADNVIIRFVNFRLGNQQVAYHEGDGLGAMDRKNIIVDHCSVSWSIDECLSVYGSHDITVQWCIASHSLRNSGHSKGAHGYGGNWGGSGASYHHNLIANHTSRTPRLGPRPGTQTDERMDFRNNVIFNYGTNGCYGGEGMDVNMVNNYYNPGLTSNSRKARIAGLGIRTLSYCWDSSTTISNINKALGTDYSSSYVSIGRVGDVDTGYNRIKIKSKSYPIDMETSTITVPDADGVEHEIKVAWNSWKPMLHTWGHLFVDGNYNVQDDEVTADNWTTGIYSQITKTDCDNYYNDSIADMIKLAQPIEYVYTTTHTAEDAYERVLNYAGASLYRDEYDAMVINDVRNNTASFGENGIIDSQDQIVYADGHTGWPVYEQLEAPIDTDGDGIPDEWEMANGLNPNDPTDGNGVAASGYTNLEVYLNSIVAHIMEAGNEGGKMLNGQLLYEDEEVELPVFGGIENVVVDGTRIIDNRIYNLMGYPVAEPLSPGIYIQAGKKFIIR